MRLLLLLLLLVWVDRGKRDSNPKSPILEVDALPLGHRVDERERQTERKAYRLAGKQTDRDKKRKAERQTDGNSQTVRKTVGHRQ